MLRSFWEHPVDSHKRRLANRIQIRRVVRRRLGGIYFATTPELTGHKAHRLGVILEATVALGRIHTLEAAGDPSMTLQKLQSLGFESVCIAKPGSHGQEYVMDNPKQVLSIRRHAPAASTILARYDNWVHHEVACSMCSFRCPRSMRTCSMCDATLPELTTTPSFRWPTQRSSGSPRLARRNPAIGVGATQDSPHK